MSIKEKMMEARNKTVSDTYELLKGTEEWQSKNKTQRLYMLCVALDITHTVLLNILKELNIEL